MKRAYQYVILSNLLDNRC